MIPKHKQFIEKEIELMKKRQSKEFLINMLFFLIIAGGFMNTGVMINNNCKMPVYFSLSEEVWEMDNTYIEFNNWSDVSYPLFSDVIGVGSLMKMSIGDIFMYSGMIALLTILVLDFITKLRRLKWH